MNMLSRAAVLSLSVVGLAGCASMDDQAGVSPQPRNIELDQDYMTRVERVAMRRGIEVMWVNPPTTDEELVAQQDNGSR